MRLLEVPAVRTCCWWLRGECHRVYICISTHTRALCDMHGGHSAALAAAPAWLGARADRLQGGRAPTGISTAALQRLWKQAGLHPGAPSLCGYVRISRCSLSFLCHELEGRLGRAAFRCTRINPAVVKRPVCQRRAPLTLRYSLQN